MGCHVQRLMVWYIFCLQLNSFSKCTVCTTLERQMTKTLEPEARAHYRQLKQERHQRQMYVKCFFLAHLSTKCSGWAIVTGLRPSCVNFFTKTSSPLKPIIGFWPNFTGMIHGWSSTKIVQTVPVGCMSRSQGQKLGFQNAIFKNLLVWNYKAQSFHIW